MAAYASAGPSPLHRSWSLSRGCLIALVARGRRGGFLSGGGAYTRLGLLIGHQIRDWVESMIQILVKLYPNSLVDGLASIGRTETCKLCAIDKCPRIPSCSFFDKSKWTLVFLLMRWAFRCHNMVLIFGGARAREARWNGESACRAATPTRSKTGGHVRFVAVLA